MTFVRNRQEKTAASPSRWHMAIYVRLSKEDGDKLESDSIRNQKRIIEQHIKYLRGQGEEIASAEVYSDDGCPGGNFERPAYKQMISDIEAGKINCVIFKDNSRLGRNYPELGRLMEDYFPQKGIRVISVLNHIDSLKDPNGYCSAIVSFSNMMNDDYIRQLSIKIKCTFAMKRERGEFLGNYAPYGYEKSPEDRHKLVIDPEAAEIVRMIFNWYAGGASARGIVKRLNAMEIPPPSVYKGRKGCKGFAGRGGGVWAATSVNTMLKDEVYIGNLVQGKRKSASYRTRKMVSADESEWTVVEGAHEAIVSDEIFTIVHDRFARRERAAGNREGGYLLSGYIKCAHCGSRMNRNGNNGSPHFRCMTHAYAPDKCPCPSVRESVLEGAILKAIQDQLRGLTNVGAMMDAARRKGRAGRAADESLLALGRAEREKNRLTEAKFRLYDSLEKGVIDQAEYVEFKERYTAALAQQEERIEALKADVRETREARRQDDAFLAFFQAHGSIEALDRDVLERLLDHVEVVDRSQIHIYFKFSAGGQKSPNPAAEPLC